MLVLPVSYSVPRRHLRPTIRIAIRFDRAAGKTAARLVFTRSGHEYTADDVGGGVVDVAELCLRLAALLLMKPAPRRLLVADEPFST